MEGNDPGIGDPIFDLVQALLFWGLIGWAALQIIISWIVYIAEKLSKR